MLPFSGSHPKVYRGINNVQVKLAVGKTVVFKEFTSTTKSHSVARGFAGSSGVLFEISGWQTGADVAKFSPYPDEEEILLAPYQTFRVTAIQGNLVKLAAA